MKNFVVNIKDLQDAAPFFKTRFGKFLAKRMFKWFCINKVNRLYNNSCHLQGADFTASLLKDPLINLKYKVHNDKILETLPEGTFVTVSNHSIGSLDGIILIDIFASRRPDFKVMVNGILTKVEALKDNFVSVKPDSEQQGANLQNLNGIRCSFAHLQDGRPMGFFPAGAISVYKKDKKGIYDHDWKESVIRIIRKSRATVYPVFFDFYNSHFFYLLDQISWKIRTLRIPAELFNKYGKTVDVYIGQPVSYEEMERIKDDTELSKYLYTATYNLKRK